MIVSEPRKLAPAGKNWRPVFVLCTATKRQDSDPPTSAITVTSSLVGQHLYDNLSCPLPPTSSERKELTQEQRDSYNAQYGRYKRSVVTLTNHLLFTVSDKLFETETKQGVSRMGEGFQVTGAKLPDLVLGQIARGGDKPTAIAKEFFWDNFGVPVGQLYSASQRKKNEDGSMSAEVMVKGRENLRGKTLIILEQALATGTTILASLKKWVEQCESEPERIIVCAIHATRDAIEVLAPKMEVVVLLLHDGINADKYLLAPGCGDVGVMDVGLRDH